MIQTNIASTLKKKRTFLPAQFVVTDWFELRPYYEQVLHFELNSLADLQLWLDNLNELDTVIKEDIAWRYIKMTCNTQDENLVTRYKYFMEEISPKIAEYSDQINRKYYECPLREQLTDISFQIFDKLIVNQIELFRVENIALESEISVKCQEYGSIIGNMTIEWENKTMTLQQAASVLLSTDRNEREKVWNLIAQRRGQDREALHQLFNELLQLRNNVAKNAGFKSYSDYRFKELARFDYSRQDCEKFHNAVEKVVKPIYQKQLAIRRQKLALEQLKPWDTKVDLYATHPLRPFKDGDDLLNKTIHAFRRLNPQLAEMIETMKTMGHFDLTSRVGKAPGGYNYPLHESGAPFIFMNAVGSQSDLKTMVHECGHAVHSFLIHPLRFNAFKDVPSEIAELASMSMELISMDVWDEFYPGANHKEDLIRAKLQQLSGAVSILPWIATVDAFQTWIYDNPQHTNKERGQAWNTIYDRFHGEELDWTGFDDEKSSSWQMQLHIYEVPFYYIEYGIAQLGALQVWKNYQQNAKQGLQNYIEGLSLGYTQPIPVVYEKAGIRFDFSEQMMQELFDFIQIEFDKLEAQLE